MSFVWHIAVSLEFVLACFLLLKSRQTVLNTTLMSAWNWSVFAMIIWAFCCFADFVFSAVSKEVADLAWHAAAVFSLTPAIAVLGSRRPGTRVWTGFILVPMLLVLGWPIGAQFLHGSEFRGLHLETPQVAAYSLVLIMGVGNYCGTRFTLPSLLFGFSLLCLVLSSSIICPVWLADRSTVRAVCLAVVSLSICLAAWSNRSLNLEKLDRLWFDFFDSFGIVWGRRIQDRVNYLLKRDRLPIRLELDGFVWLDNNQSSEADGSSSAEIAAQKRTENSDIQKFALPNHGEVEARVEHIIRWLLRRFVDPPWIDKRLETKLDKPIPEMMIDS